MAARATSALVRRTSFSSALNVLPTEINELDADILNNRIHNENDLIDTSPPKPYSSIPGPKEWPIIGNSWRFAPIIGKEFIYLNKHQMNDILIIRGPLCPFCIMCFRLTCTRHSLQCLFSFGTQVKSTLFMFIRLLACSGGSLAFFHSPVLDIIILNLI